MIMKRLKGLLYFAENIELSSSDVIFSYSWKILVYNKLELFLGRLGDIMRLKFRKAVPTVCLEL